MQVQSAMFQFYCTHCGQRITADVGAGGTKVRCPKCLDSFFAPDARQRRASAGGVVRGGDALALGFDVAGAKAAALRRKLVLSGAVLLGLAAIGGAYAAFVPANLTAPEHFALGSATLAAHLALLAGLAALVVRERARNHLESLQRARRAELFWPFFCWMLCAFGALECAAVLAFNFHPAATAPVADEEKTAQFQTGMRVLGLREYESQDRAPARPGESDLKAALRKVLRDHRAGVREPGRDLQSDVSSVLRGQQLEDKGPVFSSEPAVPGASAPVALPRPVR